jgi:hypothetical protein
MAWLPGASVVAAPADRRSPVISHLRADLDGNTNRAM